MGLPLALTAISVGAQAAKGIAKNNLAKRRMRMAKSGLADAKALERQAWSERKDFDPTNLYASMDRNRSMLMNQMNTNAAGQAMTNRSDARLSNLASQLNRTASTTGQAQAGLLAGLKTEQDAAMEANQAGIADRSRNMQLLMGIDQQQAGLENLAYKYNVETPFNLRYGQAQGDREAFLNMQLGAENMRAAAFGDYMNALSGASTAMTEGLGGLENDSWIQKLRSKKNA